MGLRNPTAVSVTTSATSIVTVGAGVASEDVTVIVANNAGSTCFVGTTGVTVANGIPLPVGGSLALTLRSGAVLVGICSSGTADIRILVGDE